MYKIFNFLAKSSRMLSCSLHNPGASRLLSLDKAKFYDYLILTENICL